MLVSEIIPELGVLILDESSISVDPTGSQSRLHQAWRLPIKRTWFAVVSRRRRILQQARARLLSVCLSWASLLLCEGGLVNRRPQKSEACRMLPRLTA